MGGGRRKWGGGKSCEERKRGNPNLGTRVPDKTKELFIDHVNRENKKLPNDYGGGKGQPQRGKIGV